MLGHCVCTYVCVCVGRERGRKKGEGICVSHIDLPQGSLGNYREVGLAPQTLVLWILLNSKV